MVEGTISHEMKAEEINKLLLQGYQQPTSQSTVQTPTIKGKGWFSASWFTPKLLEGERILETLDVGFWKLKIYRIFATNKRLIVLKKFPKNLMDMDYRQIELVEYYTNVEWMMSVYGMVLIALMFFFLTAQETVMNAIYSNVAFIEPILNRGNLFGLSFGAFIIFLGLLFGGLYFLGMFVLSLLGSLRILLYEQAPFDITTSMTIEIQDLIRFVEQQKIELDVPVGSARNLQPSQVAQEQPASSKIQKPAQQTS